jgi:hypothetical protein
VEQSVFESQNEGAPPSEKNCPEPESVFESESLVKGLEK